MAQYEGSLSRDDSRGETPAVKRISGWTVGVAVLASVMLILLGLFHVIEGIAAIANSGLYALPDNYPFEISAGTWGWIHFTGGVIVLLSGFFLLTGDKYARAVAYVVVLVSAIGNFLSIPYYPVWSIVLLAFDGIVLFALTKYVNYVSTDS